MRATLLLLPPIQFAFSLGFMMVIPFLAGYLREDMALSGAAIGLVLGMRTFSQQGMFIFGGALSDRLGPRRLILLGCLVRIAGYILLGFGGHFVVVLLGACLFGIGAALFSPALSTLVARLGDASEKAGKRGRAHYFALFVVWGELGGVFGPMVGSLLFGIGFQGLAFIGAGLFAVSAGFLFVFLPRDDVPARPHRTLGSFGPMFGNKLFMAFIVANGAALFSYEQLYLALPMEIARVGGTEHDLVPLFMVGSVMIIALQLTVTRLSRAVGVAVAMPFGFFLMALAFALVALAAPYAPASGPFALLPSICLVVLLTSGQMILGPLAMDLVPTFAGGRPVGLYFGALASAGGIFVLLGNVLVGPLLDWALVPSARAAVPWLALAAVPAASAVAMFLLTRRLDARPVEALAD